ncbi:hypothetical protein SAY86_030154 [Trapa natans]|uniref:Uncharacterized protein n=1 Tax=Trapa natans TaxID=22666 RepID=A0AAN7MQK8_TRANT|nr:hypothetical protein SAY86_030154 [Trapa natans]
MINLLLHVINRDRKFLEGPRYIVKRPITITKLNQVSGVIDEAANALHAWKLMEDLTKHIDIVLTEVAMPLYGIALLSKIMSHKTHKNIPSSVMYSDASNKNDTKIPLGNTQSEIIL